MAEINRSKRFAVIRVRGVNNVRRSVNDTCKMLNIAKLHNLSFVDDRPDYKGMLQTAKDWVTWGEVNADSVERVLSKWGRLPGNKRLTDEYVKEHTKYASIADFAKQFAQLKAELNEIPGLKAFFRLHPPRKGYDKKGIKRYYTVGGALGYRGENINSLVKKMT